mmetsp:Transcript_117849/g.334138  ORF Transcript_117849/g.334138 Transcript_117849/m.334138 type:complete len:512 (+) Transcript_117849:540-2075(+)
MFERVRQHHLEAVLGAPGHHPAPDGHRDEGAEPAVHLQVQLVILDRWQRRITLRDGIEDAGAVLRVGGLAALNADREARPDDVDAEALLPLHLAPVARARVRPLQGLLLLREAAGDEHGLARVRGREVEDRVHPDGQVVTTHAGLDVAPAPGKRTGRALHVHDPVLRLLDLGLQGHDGVELGGLHGLEVRGLPEVLGQVVLERVLPVGEGADPVCRGARELASGRVELQAIHEVHHLLPPPVDHEPRGRLLLGREHLGEGRVLLLGRRLDQPVVDVVEANVVDVQLLPGGLVAPSVAVQRCPVDHLLELVQRDGAVLDAVDVALELEVAPHLLEVCEVLGALEREPRQPLLVLDHPPRPLLGLLGADGLEVRDEPDGAAPPLPLRVLQAYPDVLAAAHLVAVYHVDLPAWDHPQLAGLALGASHDRVLPAQAVAARCGVAELELPEALESELVRRLRLLQAGERRRSIIACGAWTLGEGPAHNQLPGRAAGPHRRPRYPQRRVSMYPIYNS